MVKSKWDKLLSQPSAPTPRQIEDEMYSELRKWYLKFPDAQLQMKVLKNFTEHVTSEYNERMASKGNKSVDDCR